MTEPLTDDELASFELMAAKIHDNDACDVYGIHVPRLLAEVRRLREELRLAEHYGGDTDSIAKILANGVMLREENARLLDVLRAAEAWREAPDARQVDQCEDALRNAVAAARAVITRSPE